MIFRPPVRGLDGMCVGCRAWWSRLASYPCWQVDWGDQPAGPHQDHPIPGW